MHYFNTKCPSIEGYEVTLQDNGVCLAVPDLVSFATQTGRLDFLSAALAVVAVVLALGGVAAVFEIRYRAKLAAQETTRLECKEIAKELLKGYVNDELPDEVRRLVELLKAEDHSTGDDYGQQDTDRD